MCPTVHLLLHLALATRNPGHPGDAPYWTCCFPSMAALSRAPGGSSRLLIITSPPPRMLYLLPGPQVACSGVLEGSTNFRGNAISNSSWSQEAVREEGVDVHAKEKIP